MDNITKQQRSDNMSKIKSKNTTIELSVRKYLFSHGLRYRINVSKLPGTPDIVLKKYKTIIFVNGCFWHRHKNCKYSYTPKSNIEFWERKFNNNVINDKKNTKLLKKWDEM